MIYRAAIIQVVNEKFGETENSYLNIDGQVLTADPTDLLLNGVPIATISALPNIEEWANYDALNNVDDYIQSLRDKVTFH